ncbi:MAG TPA: hypothetical protein DCY20_05770 [Firmicutes bacterium]|nr:hypothetical protein [Bacillota bacterium]
MNGKATEAQWRSLLDVIQQFKEVKPWRYLDEQDVFVVRDPETGMEVYCCVVGPDGIHETFSVYLGAEGIDSYCKMINLDQSRIWHPSYLKTLLSQKCFMLSFENELHIDEKTRNQYQSLYYDFNGQHAYPKLSEYDCGMMPIPFYSGWQCTLMTQALMLCLKVVKLIQTQAINISFDLEELLCFEFDEQLGWQYEYVPKSKLKSCQKQELSYENDIQSYKLKKCPQSHLTFEMIQFILPDAVRDLEHERPYFPLITALIERDSRDILFAEMGYSTKESKKQMVGKIVNFMLNELRFRPLQLAVDDEELKDYLFGLCDKTDIKLLFEEKLEVAYDFMKEVLHTEDEDEEVMAEQRQQERIELMLTTTKQVCKLITDSDSLSKNLTPFAREQFSNVIELFQVTMVRHFNEYDHEWTVANFKVALNEILPSLLYDEEMAVLPLVLTEYLGILGQAGVMNNYEQFQDILQEMLDIHIEKQGLFDLNLT